MSKWKRMVNIKPLIGEDSSDSGAQECARNISALLQDKLMDLLTHDNDLADIVDAFGAVETCDDVNSALDELYDWADHNLIWLGLKLPAEVPA